MKTREQAEARALELFPPHLADNDFHGLTKRDLNEPYRKAFLKCWEEMQANKQTCGFCVETKQEQKELLCEMMRKDEASGMYEFTKDDLKELVEESEKEINLLQKDKQLREAAENVVLKWIDKCAITAEDIEKLQIALK